MGADPNAVVDGYTPLFAAGVEGHTDAIKVLIARGAGIDDGSSRALLCSWLKSIANVANTLLGGGLREGLENAMTCERLTLVIGEGDVRMVQVLLASWQVFRSLLQLPSSESPLIRAVQDNVMGVVRFLLNCGGNLDVEDSEGRTLPVHCILPWAWQSGDAQVDKATNDGMTPLHGASMHGKIEMCTDLLAKNASVDIKNQTGDTPLHLAVSNDHFGVVQALISAGAIVNVVNHTGDTPLIVAARHGYLETAQALLTAGARVEMVNKSGELAIVAATRCGHISIVKKLLVAGANVHALASDVDNLLVAADRWGHPITASLLLERAELVIAQSSQVSFVDVTLQRLNMFGSRFIEFEPM
uniref:Uncharacterized protein n=1 Tax=Globisporangium ultimum (strain ATCC 200006 / CBS 805.95 / DAOM BR144) TaxID=431595 RepID=K3WW17_GLOUD